MNVTELLRDLSALTSVAILIAAAVHLLLFLVLWQWQRRDWQLLAGCLEEFTRELRHRSVLRPAVSLARQVDAFIQDIRDLLHQRDRHIERAACLERIHVLDERRQYLDSLSFETVSKCCSLDDRGVSVGRSAGHHLGHRGGDATRRRGKRCDLRNVPRLLVALARRFGQRSSVWQRRSS